ncbi:MAG: response regulator [Deltaproteobacteria bacterium]|nr:response regulator [Deltaproteobacteria bacterium]
MQGTPKPVILIVDDEPDNLDLLERALRSEYVVHRAASGHEALQLLPDLPELSIIITDQRMPGLAGTEMLRKARVRRPEAVRIILTGYTEPADLIDAINNSNVYRYLTKPFRPDELRLLLRRALRVNRAGGGYMVDEVTGLANRGLLQRQLARELARADRLAAPLVVVAIRVNGVSECIAALGEPTTELMIANVAESLEKQIRAMDILGYYDPGIFLAILPGCSEPETAVRRLVELAEQASDAQTMRTRVSALGFSGTFVKVAAKAGIDEVRRALQLPD